MPVRWPRRLESALTVHIDTSLREGILLCGAVVNNTQQHKTQNIVYKVHISSTFEAPITRIAHGLAAELWPFALICPSTPHIGYLFGTGSRIF